MGTGGGLVVIDFSEQGNSARFRRDGWSGQEADRVWGIGPRSLLAVPIQSSGRPIVLEAEIAPGAASAIVRGQVVRIQINGDAIGGARIDRRTMIRCKIDRPPADRDGKLEIEFGFPGFYRADMLGGSGDDRPLSCWFSFVRVYTTDMFKPGPWFPPSHPEIPVLALSPPIAAERGVDGSDAEAEAAVWSFGESGSVSPFLRDGWSGGERGFAWTEGVCSQLELPAPRIPGSYVLRVDASPFLVPEEVPKQNVTILLDGIVIGQYSFDQPSAWVVPLPGELVHGRNVLALTFMLPTAARPSDHGSSLDKRLLGMAVTRVGVLPFPSRLAPVEDLRNVQTNLSRPIALSGEFLKDDGPALRAAVKAALGMDTAALSRGFESLGTDSEFGIVQRKLGLEVINLFRFCEVALPDLTRALTDDLKAAADPDLVTIELNGANPREYVLALPSYNLRWHMVAHEDDAGRDSLRRDNAIALGYMRRKFYEGLRAGQKIYVLKQGRPVPIGQAAVLLLELSRSGPATLLCVEEASNGRRPGEVELLMRGLMRGYIRKSAPDTDIGSAGTTAWLRVLANAALLKRGPAAILAS